MFEGMIAAEALVPSAKSAFSSALTHPEFFVLDAEGGTQPLWPIDEPFRLSNPEVLAEAIRIVDDLIDGESRVADPLGTAFDAFLSGRYDHSGGLGTFLTPSSVAKAMADIALDIADPLSGWDGRSAIIADPFCGTGRFLVAAFDALQERGAPTSQLADLLDHGLLGADQSASAISKTALNLMLYGARNPHASIVADSMIDVHLDQLAGSLRLVLTNPPFGGGKYFDPVGITRSESLLGPLRGKAIDPALAGLARSVHLLADGGVLGIVLPDGIVGGKAFDALVLRPDVAMVASVSLPTVTFSLSGTVAKTSAVFLQKASTKSRILLARVDHVGFLRQAGKAVIDPDGSELPGVVSAIRSELATPATENRVVHVSEAPLVASVPSLGLTSFDPSRLDPDAIQNKLSLMESGGMPLSRLLRKARRQPRHKRAGEPFISVLHVDALGTISWHDAQTYTPSTPGQWANSGQVIVSLLNPSKLRAGVIPDEIESAMCSAEFGVFEADCNPYAILGLLYNPKVQIQLQPLGTGTSSSRRRISEEDVLDLVVPMLTTADLEQLGRDTEEQVRAIEIARTHLHAIQRGR